MRLIDADAFFSEFGELDKEPYNNAPTVDPIRHGHWIAHGKAFMGATIEACSECGELLCGYNKAYCPNCGAKMDEVTE